MKHAIDAVPLVLPLARQVAHAGGFAIVDLLPNSSSAEEAESLRALDATP